MSILRSRANLFKWTILGAFFLSVLVCAASGFAGERETDSPPQTATATISGRVSVASSQGVSNNLASITVLLTGPQPATTSQNEVSDAEGRFQFSKLAPGVYKLDVTVEGFKPWSSTVTLVAGQALVQDVGLQLNLVEENVEVKGEATEVETESVTPECHGKRATTGNFAAAHR